MAPSAAEVFDVDVLDVAPRLVKPQATWSLWPSDDEGNAGEGDAGDVEVAGGGWGGIEVGLVPDAGDAVGEVHIVGEERLAGGGVGAGDDPVVGAGEAAVADGVAEGLLEGEEVLGMQRGGEFFFPILRGEATKDGVPGLCCLCGGSAVALASLHRAKALGGDPDSRDVHISESRCGAPGFVFGE